MPSVSLGLLLRVANTLGISLASIAVLVDTHEADEADVRCALQEAEERKLGARRQPQALEVLAAFERALPSLGVEA